MNQDEFFTSHLSRMPVIAILRGFEAAEAVSLADRAWDSEIALVEVPIQDDTGRKALEAVALRAKDRGRPVGAGTVLSPNDVDFAEALGCAFTVAPDLNEAVCDRAAEMSLFHLPGVATATEVAKAKIMGLIWQKAFPAKELGIGWFSSMRGPFPRIKFVATGGIDASNVEQFLDGGADAVGIGSAFTDPQVLSLATQSKRKALR